MSPDAVLFDLDSTLCRSTQGDEALHAAVFDRAGVEPFCDVATIRAVGPEVESAEDDREGAGQVDADALARATLAVTDDAAVEWRPGAREALATAREHGPVGLVTNGGRDTQRTRLDVLGGDPENALYVGNDYRADVIGAKRAGLSACWVPGQNDPGAPADATHVPDYTFDSPAELTNLF